MERRWEGTRGLQRPGSVCGWQLGVEQWRGDGGGGDSFTSYLGSKSDSPWDAGDGAKGGGRAGFMGPRPLH